jgi:hypothetical protein
MLIWAVVQSRISSRPVYKSGGPTYLVQGLDPTDIDSIVIGKGDDAVTLKRQDDGFVVVNKQNYPAKTSQINNLISKCLEIEGTQFVTDKPENHQDLEVTEEKARTVVKFFRPDSTLLTGIIIGKSTDIGQGSYVRLASDDKVYVSQNVPPFSSGAMSFVDQQLTSIKREDIASVMVGSSDGNFVLKAKEIGSGIEMENVPAGKKFKNTEGQNVFNALTNLSFADVMKDSNDMTFERQYVCRLKDSTEYTVNITTEDDKTFVTCSARFTDQRPATIRKDESEEELKIKEAKLLADDKAKEFTAKHKGWIYEVPDYKSKNLKVKLSDLLEDQREPAKDESTALDEVTSGGSAVP